MIDRTHAGVRCHTRRMLCTVRGNLPRESPGTVVYEMDKLGRHLIVVTWDIGITVPVFPDEIELQPQYSRPRFPSGTGFHSVVPPFPSSDGTATSTFAEVAITILAPNDPPACN